MTLASSICLNQSSIFVRTFEVDLNRIILLVTSFIDVEGDLPSSSDIDDSIRDVDSFAWFRNSICIQIMHSFEPRPCFNRIFIKSSDVVDIDLNGTVLFYVEI